MSTQPITFNASDIDSGQSPTQSQSNQTANAPVTFSVADIDTPPATTDPRQTGEITNDVGQKVIVPKDGESFSDTMKRAVAYHKSLTPQQQQAALDAETKTIPAKALEAGIGGPLAAVGSYAAGAMGLDAPSALYDLAVKHLAGNVLPSMEEQAAKAKLLELAPKVYKIAKELGIAGTGLTLLWKAVADHK